MAHSIKQSLDTKSKCIWVIIDPPKGATCFPIEYLNAIDLWLSDNAQRYAYIVHNLDCENDGTPKIPHLHLWAELKVCQRLLTSLNALAKTLACDTMQISIEKPVSMEGCVQYLIHKNDPEKTQYDMASIRATFSKEELKSIMETEAGVFSLSRLESICCRSKNLLEVVRAVGIPIYEKHIRLIRDVWNSCHGRN